jgi:hypothetical protein
MTHVFQRSIDKILGDDCRNPTMNAGIGWALAVLALAAGYLGYGWRGVLLAITVVAFWLLLQFSQALRVMRAASARPLGSVDSALMLHSKLHPGMRLVDIIKLTRSLGQALGTPGSDPEHFRWVDAGGDAVRVELVGGKLVRSELERAPGDGASPGAAAS